MSHIAFSFGKPSECVCRGPSTAILSLCWTLLFLSLDQASAQGQSKPSADWPSFRGPSASGMASKQHLPLHWNAEEGTNILWKSAIPGLAHSSPIVSRGRLFVTTAVNTETQADFKHGLYGAGTAADDQGQIHQWKLFCLDAASGRILWERTAHQGLPRSKRHIKSTHANSTPAADGTTVVVFFGSEGLYAYDFEGRQLWKKDVGRLDLGAYNAPGYEWGPASSPIIYQDLAIIQCDTQQEDFLMAVDLKSGETRWRTGRDEYPSWGTPNVWKQATGDVLVTNASNFIKGYDPRNGQELWRLGGSSMITAPTPVFTADLAIVASGRRPQKPIFAIRAGAKGDITPRDGEDAGEGLLWSKTGRGPYMPTPLILDDRLYSLNNNGIFDCYELKSGAEVYRKRISHGGGGFSASPVTADGLIYLSSEDGDIVVVKAGPEFAVAAVNPMGERLMSTPAIAGGRLFVRGEKHLFAIGR